MDNETYYYCNNCGRYVGTSIPSKCPHCPAIFGGVAEKLGTITRPKVTTRLNLKPLILTIGITVVGGSCFSVFGIGISILNAEWAALLSSLITSLMWQATLSLVFFLILFSALKGLLSEKTDYLLVAFDNGLFWALYNVIQRLREAITPVIRHRRLRFTLILLSATIFTLILLPKVLDRPLDLRDVILTLGINIIGNLWTIPIQNLIEQKEQINKSRDWRPPRTIAEWQMMSQNQGPLTNT